MTDVRILQHVRPEAPGTITDALDAHALVVIGGPRPVGDVYDRPHLSRELDLIG